jgi:hypothetical protein
MVGGALPEALQELRSGGLAGGGVLEEQEEEVRGAWVVRQGARQHLGVGRALIHPALGAGAGQDDSADLSGAAQGDLLSDLATQGEAEQVVRGNLRASMKVMASRLICWMVLGVVPMEPPTPTLSTRMTSRLAAMVSMSFGSQLSRVPR